jgi:hypothetical protein
MVGMSGGINSPKNANKMQKVINKMVKNGKKWGKMVNFVLFLHSI